MQRRDFNKQLLSAGLASLSGIWPWSAGKTHILSLSFDDGFKNSFQKIADIYEKHDLKACLNVIASAHLKGFKQVDDWILPELMGDFDIWNGLAKRGHEIMPHSWKHLNLARIHLPKAKRLINKCLDYFEEHLEGYNPDYAVFNFPFNSSNPALEQFTLQRVKGIRTFGQGAINPIPQKDKPLKISCSSYGPTNIDAWVNKNIQDFLADPKGGWMVLNLHGLDTEGWGPISTGFLKKQLEQLTKIDYLEIMPAGEVLKRTIGN
ncbi:MAG: polysaccharide deacetylase family protein [Bacteroidota bacterium]